LIENGDYEEIIDGRLVNNNPINTMQNNLKKHLKEHVENGNITQNFANSLILPNPTVPHLYGLPKIHKPGGRKMRQIISCCNSPIVNLAKWVARELQSLCFEMEFEVKNSLDFVEKVKDVELEDDELMVSFDVEALFPSVPLNHALNTIKHHLSRMDIPQQKRNFLIKSIELCAEMNQFQFRGKFYKQTSGLPIGLPVSPILSSFFMLHFENKIKRYRWFPRVYFRYVDDIFAIVKANEVEEVKNLLCSQFESINFTVEREKEGKLPFLDLNIERRNRKLDFSIYRKPSATQLFIGADSNHSKSHKFAAFHSMFHRLFNIPMSLENFNTEKDYIFSTGLLNGFNTLNKMFKKHERKREITNITSLESIDEDVSKFISIPFCPPLTHRLSNELKKFGYRVVYNNNGEKLSDLLGSTKDRIPDDEKSGIYEINCLDCDATYIGKSKRKIKIRGKEHQDDCRKPPSEEKPVAKHSIELNHNLGEIKLLKEVRKVSQLDSYESLFLNRFSNKNLINIQKLGNNPSVLYKFVQSQGS
jgi:hypothetical protein